MSVDFSIVEIESSWRTGQEDMGSKPKFWFRMNGDGQRWLFKRARPHTGEHWAEKITSEIASELFGLPTHEVRLAIHEGKEGCAVRSFLVEGETLVHGNEVLAGAIEGYDRTKQRRQSDHNLVNIQRAFFRFNEDEEEASRFFRQFVGYLVLDAFAGNTDRHHENWGVLLGKVRIVPSNDEISIETDLSLAPTFDHGSSLGRELLDERRELLLRDPMAFAAYLRKGYGGLYTLHRMTQRLSPLVEW